MVTPERTPKRIAADITALDWFAAFVEAADPILIGKHGYEIEGCGGDWAPLGPGRLPHRRPDHQDEN